MGFLTCSAWTLLTHCLDVVVIGQRGKAESRRCRIVLCKVHADIVKVRAPDGGNVKIGLA